ncbi:myosin-IIIb-like isoform X1 [Neocloeon triangulifer]|uniref:myosin-IIIb-like isoform X1 n=2 Tax=Neocloeon triangulifer TaxID=2078957 RepID=UPI00286F0D73|nr:myosin-IIIb-like isoform X1 [Neocloeon triangulifer]XP_059476388.1 myosin-IIIb-like isoform X1 [Neocloeon triangulifer]XP_059476389.1 myosin-IIIb-like isoform X1 [Neocloeon triangulifer]
MMASHYHGLSQHITFEQLPDPSTRFQLEQVIGEGTYGEVFCAKDLDSGQRVAVKVLENVADNVEEIEEEYLVLRDLSLHPNIPLFHGLFLKRGATPDDDQLWFAMELCGGGSVTDLVQGLKKRGQALTTDQIGYILHETVQALLYLHQHHCMHRDVKGHNILLTNEACVKLVDFGVSSHLGATLGRRSTSVGTPYWMAPEVIACEQQLDASYDARCDVWSLGVTAIELAEGDPPLSELHPMRALFQIPRNPPPGLQHPEHWHPDLADFISESLIKDLEQRPFARELLEHPLIKRGAISSSQSRHQLKEEIDKQRAEGRVIRQPEVTTKHGKLKSDRKSRPQQMYMDDLAALDNLSEDTIVQQLEKRFDQRQIYTYIGDILVAVNPFNELGLYTEKEQRRYRGQARSENPPHIFAVADAAYQALLHQRQNQAIVISGESGAGKTESANLLLKQLVFLGKAPNRNLEDRILQVNPIMEAFGNAQTGINDNSSRFGKYLDLTMTNSGKVTGARISVYLLEQSRVVQQATGERNFHVFYYLYDGLEWDGRMKRFHLDVHLRGRHRYLAGDRQDKATKQINIGRFQQLKEGFKLLGFKEEEVDAVYCILAAILHLGDLEFGEIASDDNTDKSRVMDLAPLHRVCALLGVEACDLLEALTSNSVVTRGETITRNNTVAEANAARDAMAKGLYGRLFDWIVNQINRLLALNRYTCKEPLAIGLLDIFGFENFSKNSFEQLCINVANEQIQYYFNQHIFTWEQQEYMAEGIPVDLVEFSDNRPVLDMLLSRPMGLLALLDEESRFPRSSDSSLVSKFHNNVKSKFYVRPKSNALCFAIHHYAGRVVYQAEGFLEKNKNFLPPEVIQLLRQSEVDTVRFLFQCPLTKTGNLYSSVTGPPPSGELNNNARNLTPPDLPYSDHHNSREKFSSRGLASQSRAQQTVATYFRYSLMDLLQKMVSGYPQFVRCVKPNDSRRPGVFDREKILKQLRYTGVMETIRIRQHGFSHRLTFSEFLRRYYFLAFGYDERVVANRDTCRLLLLRLKLDGWALGKTKVFLKYYHVEYLSKMYEEQLRKIVLVQSCIRRWLAKIRYDKNKWKVAASVLVLQKYLRGWKARREAKMLREERNRKRREELREQVRRASQGSPTKAAGAWIQNKLLSVMSHGDNEKENKKKGSSKKDEAATVIQSHYRGYTVRRKWSAEAEGRVRRVLASHNNPRDALVALQEEGLDHEEAAELVTRHYHGWRQQKYPAPPPPPAYPKGQQKKNKDRQAELIAFSQNVHMVNQDAHKFLRRNKPGVRLQEVTEPPVSYQRPRGFNLIPHLINKADNSVKNKQNNHLSYYNALKQEMNRASPEEEDKEEEDDVDCWDGPLLQLQQKLRPKARGQPDGVDLQKQRREMIAASQSQARLNERRESNILSAWHSALPGDKTDRVKHIGKQVIDSALNQRIKELHRQDSNNSLIQVGNSYVTDPPTMNNNRHTQAMQFSPASDLRRLLRQGDNTPSYHESGSDDIGPYNFKQLLRPTEYAPTESLRKRKGLAHLNQTSLDDEPVMRAPSSKNPQDSPTKRRARPPVDILRRKY